MCRRTEEKSPRQRRQTSNSVRPLIFFNFPPEKLSTVCFSYRPRRSQIPNTMTAEFVLVYFRRLPKVNATKSKADRRCVGSEEVHSCRKRRLQRANEETSRVAAYARVNPSFANENLSSLFTSIARHKRL